MARDIAINENRRTEYNEGGDARNANDITFVINRVFIGIYEFVDMSPPQFTDTAIEEQRGKIETAVRRNSFTEPPIRVTVKNVDYDERFIKYSISTKRIDEIISTS